MSLPSPAVRLRARRSLAWQPRPGGRVSPAKGRLGVQAESNSVQEPRRRSPLLVPQAVHIRARIVTGAPGTEDTGSMPRAPQGLRNSLDIGYDSIGCPL